MDHTGIRVVIDHPFGTLEMPLADWMRQGPGPRPLLRPVRCHTADGTPLPLSAIPLPYRNDPESWRAILDGRCEDPWNRPLAHLARYPADPA